MRDSLDTYYVRRDVAQGYTPSVDFTLVMCERIEELEARQREYEKHLRLAESSRDHAIAAVDKVAEVCNAARSQKWDANTLRRVIMTELGEWL